MARTSWFDEKAKHEGIQDRATKLESFTSALADGVVSKQELDTQEQRHMMEEALEALEGRGIHLDTLRIRAFPFHDDVFDFISNHERVFVVEQNRDKQMRTLLTTELEIDPARLVPIVHYDGTPITARFIGKAIADATI